MTFNRQKSITTAPYVLSGFLLILMIDILYDVFTDPSYLYLAILLIPLYIYTGIGINKQWPSSRNILVVLTMLLFVGTFTSFVVILFISEESISTSPRILNKVILGFGISPVMFFILGKKMLNHISTQLLTVQQFPKSQ